MPNQSRNGTVGLVFNIQKFSLHDGPGIRTTVFIKGCPLRCQWCSNPESLIMRPEIMTYDVRCLKCFKCVEACPLEAITIVDGMRTIDRGRCDLCLKCAEVCPSKAIEVVGDYMTVSEVVEEVEKDKLFYLNSDGGMTISGGEPLLQWEFVREVFKQCKEKGIHTALDTTGYAPWDDFQQVLDYVDLVLYDIKHIDPVIHKQGAGVTNELILDNATKIASKKTKLWLRVPVIPGYNDSEASIKKITEFGTELKAEKISLLPYHCWGEQKYGRLGKDYPFKGTPIPTQEHIDSLKEISESYGLKVSIGR